MEKLHSKIYTPVDLNSEQYLSVSPKNQKSDTNNPNILKEKTFNNNIEEFDNLKWFRESLDHTEILQAANDIIGIKELDVLNDRNYSTNKKSVYGDKRTKPSAAEENIPESHDLDFLVASKNDSIVQQNECFPKNIRPSSPKRINAYRKKSPIQKQISPSKQLSLAANVGKNEIEVYTGREIPCAPNDNHLTHKSSEESLLNNMNTRCGVLSKDDSSDGDNDDDDDADNDDDDDNYDTDFSNGNESDLLSDSSDSEDGYRSHVFKLTHALEPVATTQSCLSAQSSEESLSNPSSVLVPSLFPHVPPYISFSSHNKKGPTVPPELYRVLKWRVSNVMPKVVRLVLANSGMRLLKKTNDWMGVWGKHMKSPCFKTVRPYQKINHLPGSFKIGRKDSCWQNLRKQMIKHGKKEFGFMPKTYIVPRDLSMLRKNWARYEQRNIKWIIKPPASARGTGIRVINKWTQIPKRKPLIVQKYIERPLLINGSKFDLRLYVLVTSVNPLRVFMYHNGLARFAAVKYSDKVDTLHDRCMHLTNYSINKFSSNYSKNEDVNACHGHKWTLKSLWTYLSNRGVRTDFLWAALRSLVLRTLLSGEFSINNMIKINVDSKYSCYELFGFDILLDADLIPWLLEVNISPSLHSELPLDAHVKAPLVQSILNTALFNVPPKLSMDLQKEIAASVSCPIGPICYDKRLYINYLSKEEKIKHSRFTQRSLENRSEYINSILEELTPDDVRCLIIAEDELSRSEPLERIFPTRHTYKYLKYTEATRYYNRLLDAWENRYSQNRAMGIELLRYFCEKKFHLEVPTSPAKKNGINNQNYLQSTKEYLRGESDSSAIPEMLLQKKLLNASE